MVIERVRPFSAAKVVALLYGCMGLLFGVLFALFAFVGGLATGAFAANPSRVPTVGGAFGLAAIVLFPIGYALIGLVMTLVSAWLYNLAASIVGGIEIDVR